jgi:hypothetical protein
VNASRRGDILSGSIRISAIQVLAHATTEFAKTADLCVEMKILPTLFGIFMGRNKTVGVKPTSDDAKQQIEGVVSIIANLLHYTKPCDLAPSSIISFPFCCESRYLKTDVTVGEICTFSQLRA